MDAETIPKRRSWRGTMWLLSLNLMISPRLLPQLQHSPGGCKTRRMRATTGLEMKYQNKMRTKEAPKQFIKIAKADRPRDWVLLPMLPYKRFIVSTPILTKIQLQIHDKISASNSWKKIQLQKLYQTEAYKSWANFSYMHQLLIAFIGTLHHIARSTFESQQHHKAGQSIMFRHQHHGF